MRKLILLSMLGALSIVLVACHNDGDDDEIIDTKLHPKSIAGTLWETNLTDDNEGVSNNYNFLYKFIDETKAEIYGFTEGKELDETFFVQNLTYSYAFPSITLNMGEGVIVGNFELPNEFKVPYSETSQIKLSFKKFEFAGTKWKLEDEPVDGGLETIIYDIKDDKNMEISIEFIGPGMEPATVIKKGTYTLDYPNITFNIKGETTNCKIFGSKILRDIPDGRLFNRE